MRLQEPNSGPCLKPDESSQYSYDACKTILILSQK
jgi:hypothetical protein